MSNYTTLTSEEKLEAALLLEKVLESLSQPGKYTDIWFAVDANGQRCDTTSPQAIAWDGVGAIMALRDKPEYQSKLKIISYCEELLCGLGIERKYYGFRDYQDVYRAAINYCRGGTYGKW